MSKNEINLAVITGAKAHDVTGFQRLFHSLPGIHSTIQHMDDFAASPESVRDSYDVVLFFSMHQETPVDDGLPGYCGHPKSALEHLSESGQGIVLLHHALLAYPGWPLWDAIAGMHNRVLTSYKHDETLSIQVADPTHPVTHTLSTWQMVDETYQMASPGGQVTSLLTTDHPDSMRVIAWAHQYKANRVFCLQSGHDAQTWDDFNFRQVLANGILWSKRPAAGETQV